MTTFQGIDAFISPHKTVVTIGTFDGVHVGHRKIIRHLVNTAKINNCKSVILTFFPHPRAVLHGQETIQLLNTIDERIALLQQTGVDYLIVHPFDAAFSSLSAEEFITTILVEKLKVNQIIVGHDHRFGKNRTADYNDLVTFGHKYGFDVAQIEPEMQNEVKVSSTKIRTALQNGNCHLANQYLGKAYPISGCVHKGNQLGRTLGFPTANLKVEGTYKLIPKRGVYLVQSVLQHQTVYGLMNIGIRPTIEGTTQTIEVHFLNFEANLYDQKITVELLEFIREEQKFDSIEGLKLQLEKDKEWAIQAIHSLQ